MYIWKTCINKQYVMTAHAFFKTKHILVIYISTCKLKQKKISSCKQIITNIYHIKNSVSELHCKNINALTWSHQREPVSIVNIAFSFTVEAKIDLNLHRWDLQSKKRKKVFSPAPFSPMFRSRQWTQSTRLRVCPFGSCREGWQDPALGWFWSNPWRYC